MRRSLPHSSTAGRAWSILHLHPALEVLNITSLVFDQGAAAAQGVSATTEDHKNVADPH